MASRKSKKKTSARKPSGSAKKKASPRSKAQGAAKKSAAKKSAAKKSAAKKSAAKKSAAKKSAAKKKVVKKPAPRPAARKATPSAPRKTTAPRPSAREASPGPSSPARPAPARPSPARTPPPRPPARSTPRGSPPPASGESLGLPTPEWLAVEGIGDERRRFQRVEKEMKVRLAAGKTDDSYLEAHLESIDMSLSGIFLRSTFFLPEGTPVRVEFDGPWGQTARADGYVARVSREGDRTGFGIHFSGMDETSLTDLVCMFVGDRIETFVKSFCRQKGREANAEIMWEGILAWELERLRRLMEEKA